MNKLTKVISLVIVILALGCISTTVSYLYTVRKDNYIPNKNIIIPKYVNTLPHTISVIKQPNLKQVKVDLNKNKVNKINIHKYIPYKNDTISHKVLFNKHNINPSRHLVSTQINYNNNGNSSNTNANNNAIIVTTNNSIAQIGSNQSPGVSQETIIP